MRSQLKGELALEPHGLALLGLKALVVASQRTSGLAAELALLLGVAKPSPPPARVQQTQQLGQSGGLAGVEAFQHLVDEDPEPLVERRLLGNPEHAGELVLQRAGAIGV